MNPTTPITMIPRKQIFTENQSSLMPGFLASLTNLEHDLRNDINPKLSDFLLYTLVFAWVIRKACIPKVTSTHLTFLDSKAFLNKLAVNFLKTL